VIDSRLHRVIVRCLQFDPKDRFPNVLEILPVIDGTRGRSRMRRALLTACVAVPLVAVLVLVVTQWRERVKDAVRLTSETGMAGAPNISADGKWVAYTSDRGQPGNLDIWIQSTAGGQARRLTTDPAIDTDPTLSPDGRLVAFRSERSGGGIYTAATDGSGDSLLVAGGRSPAFSPDGRWIAYWKGNRDDVVPSGELYKISPHGGIPIRLAGDFADARYPTWNSNGQSILFEGCRSSTSALTACTEWWVMQADGGRVVDSGALRLLQSQKIAILTPPVKSWLGNEVIFSAAHGPVTALWALPLSSGSGRLTGAPRQITSGDVKERDPSVATTGTIAFGRITGALHIWRVPLERGGADHVLRLTNEAGTDGCPSVSRDGHWLYFTRNIGGVRRLVVMDLTTGRESPLVFSDDDKFWPVASPTGSRVVVETRHLADSAIWLVERDGRARKLCSGCSHPTSWLGGANVILYITSKGEIAKLDAATSRFTVVLSPDSGGSLSGADWSAAHEYLLFMAGRHGGARQAFAVRFPQFAGAPQGDWIPLSLDDAEMELPHWSHDGRTIFFLSKRDGNNCLWGLMFDAAGQRVIGRPFSIMHYHDPRLTPDQASPVVRGLSVSADSVFLNIGEVTDSMWIGRLTAPPWLGWWDKLSFAR
jgi:Tol biopolymer transport system component